MVALYNEIEPYAADWLENLIAEGHIAPGVVDRRDIRDLTPEYVSRFTQCHFFAGIGVWSYALRRAGWPDDRPVWTGSCPCQPFSAAGRRGGTADERHLWPHWFHLIDVCRPSEVFGEQVASKDGLGWLDLVSADLEGADYAFGVQDLCAAGVGAPHIRQRLYFAGARELGDTGEARLSFRERSALVGTRWRQEGRATQQPGRSSDRLADDEGQRQRAGLCDRGSVREWGHFAADSEPARRLANHDDSLWGPDCPGWDDSDWPDAGRQEGPGDPEGRRRVLGLGHAHSTQSASDTRDDGEVRGIPEAEREPELGPALHVRGSGTVGLEHPDLPLTRAQREQRSRELRGLGGDQGAGSAAQWPGPTNGPWRDADWLFCRDGKWRPVEPGTFPLAHGATSRVGRLRAYGNAIVAEVAQHWIETFLESESAGHADLLDVDLDLIG